MTIILPVDSPRRDSPICVSFGRAPVFMLYDTETQETRYADNPAADAEGGAGPKAAQAILDMDADALLTIRLGQNAAEVLKAAEVQIYKAVTGTATDNLKAFSEGKLEIMTQFHAGFHGHA